MCQRLRGPSLRASDLRAEGIPLPVLDGVASDTEEERCDPLYPSQMGVAVAIRISPQDWGGRSRTEAQPG
jgi:hypothetical protein